MAGDGDTCPEMGSRIGRSVRIRIQFRLSMLLMSPLLLKWSQSQGSHRRITFGVVLRRPGTPPRLRDAFHEGYSQDRAPFAVASGAS